MHVNCGLSLRSVGNVALDVPRIFATSMGDFLFPAIQNKITHPWCDFVTERRGRRSQR